MARNAYSGSAEQLLRQVATAVDKLLGSLEGQLLYRQLTPEHEAFVKGLVKDVEGRFRFVRRYQITTAEAPEPDEQDQEKLALVDAMEER